MSTELSISDLRDNLVEFQITLSKSSIRYPFEHVIEESETKLPKGMELKNIKRIERLKKPVRNIFHVPNDILNLPFSAILQQPWFVYLKLSLLSILLFIAPIISFIFAIDDPLIITMSIVFLVLGTIGSLFYFKFTHWALFKVMNREKYPWIEEPIKEDYEKYYTRPLNKLPSFIQLIAIILSLTVATSTGISMANQVGFTNIVGLGFVLLLSFISFLSLMGPFYLMLISTFFIQMNTRSYSTIMGLIKKKTQGYVYGYESILSKQNYEITWILGNSPGHSIREFEFIPLAGFGVLTISTLSIVVITVSSALMSFNYNPDLFIDGLNLVVLTTIIAFIISVVFSLVSVMWPLFPLGYVMWRFRGKALNELDTYLFDELTKVSLGEEREVKSETQVIFFLRSYLSSLKSAPISPLKIVQILILILSYFFTIVRLLMESST